MSLLHKELLTLAHRPLTHWLRVVCGGGLLAVLAFYWITADVAGSDLVQRSFLGRQLYVWLFTSAFLLGIFVLPPFLIGTIVEERNNGTFDLLRISPLTNGQIVQHKLVSRLLLVGSFCLTGLPLTALCLTLGGVAPIDLGLGVLRCIAGALLVGTYALDLSLRGETLRYTWGSTLLFLFATPFAVFRSGGCLLLGGIGIIPFIAPWLFPFYTLAYSFNSVEFEPWVEVPVFAIAFAGSIYHLRSAVRHVRHSQPPGGVRWRRRERFSYGKEAKKRRLGALQRVAKQAADVASGRRNRDHALPPPSVMQRRKRNYEMRRFIFLRRSFERWFGHDPFLMQTIQRTTSSIFDDILLSLSCLTLIAGAPALMARLARMLYSDNAFSSPDGSTLMVMVGGNILLIIVVTLYESSRSIVRLRRNGMLPILLTSPLQPAELMRGLTLGTIWVNRAPFISSILLALIWGICSFPVQWAIGVPLLVVGVVLGVHAIATVASLLCRDEGTALFATGLALFPPVLGVLFLGPLVSPAWRPLILAVNPFATLATDPASIAGLWTPALTGGLWAAVGVLGLGYARFAFDRSTGRLPATAGTS